MIDWARQLDSGYSVAVAGLIINAVAWLFAQRQLRAILRIEDQDAMSTLRASEEQRTKSYKRAAVGNLAIAVGLLAIMWLRAG